MRGNHHSRQKKKKNPIVFLVLQLRCETSFITVYRVSCTVHQILESLSTSATVAVASPN